MTTLNVESIHHTSVVAVNVTATCELLCMLATFVYVSVGMHPELSLLTYKGHHGLFHYTPEDYTLEVFSDSDWAKHRSTRKSVSSGFIFPFWNLRYSSSRLQRRLHSLKQKLKSMQQLVHAVMEYFWNTAWVSSLEDPGKWSPSSRWGLQLADPFFFVQELDISAISLFMSCACNNVWKTKVWFLHMSQFVKTLQTWGPTFSKRQNGVSHVLCKVYSMDTSEFVGINAYDKIQEQDSMKASIRLLKEQGYSTPKLSPKLPTRLESYRDGYSFFSISCGWCFSSCFPGQPNLELHGCEDFRNCFASDATMWSCSLLLLAVCFGQGMWWKFLPRKWIRPSMKSLMNLSIDLVGEYGMKEMLKLWNKSAVAIWTARCASALMIIGDLYTMVHLALTLLMRNPKSPPSPCCAAGTYLQNFVKWWLRPISFFVPESPDWTMTGKNRKCAVTRWRWILWKIRFEKGMDWCILFWMKPETLHGS